MGTLRKSLAEYFLRLEEQDGYMSLRTQIKRLRAQEQGQTENAEDAQDDREDVDYMAEMDNLNKSGNISPIKKNHTNVMNPPTAPQNENQPQKDQKARPNENPAEKNPTTDSLESKVNQEDSDNDNKMKENITTPDPNTKLKEN